MIDKKYRREDLIGRKCRPVRDIQTNGGDGISPATVCKIVEVVRGHGFTIKTEKCPCCGQYSYITGVSRNDLKLILEEDYTSLCAGSDLWCVVEDEDVVEHCKIHDIVFKNGKVDVFSVYFDNGDFDEFYGYALGDNFFTDKTKAMDRLAANNKTPI